MSEGLLVILHTGALNLNSLVLKSKWVKVFANANEIYWNNVTIYRSHNVQRKMKFSIKDFLIYVFDKPISRRLDEDQ